VRCIACPGRGAGPLVDINCEAIADGLIETEPVRVREGRVRRRLRRAKVGLFELAGGGTLFMDEIVGLEPKVQGEAACVLSSRARSSRVGGTQESRGQRAHRDGHEQGSLIRTSPYGPFPERPVLPLCEHHQHRAPAAT
jgi:hypothetical protein